jgi:uncharacterized protein
MTSVPGGRPVPRSDRQTAPYWAGAQRHQLLVRQCPDSGRLVHPSKPCCPECLRTDLDWTQVSGDGRVSTFCVMWADFVPGFDTPYVVADISLTEQPSLRITANIIGSAPTDVFIGAPVRVCFEAREDDLLVPQFELIK